MVPPLVFSAVRCSVFATASSKKQLIISLSNHYTQIKSFDFTIKQLQRCHKTWQIYP